MILQQAIFSETNLLQNTFHVFFAYSLKMAFDRGDKDAAHLHGSRTDQ